MDRLFPFDSLFSGRDPNPKVIAIDEEDADQVIKSLKSETARQILSALFEEPRTMSELAVEIDTSVQNVDYHLQKFKAAGVVKPVDTLDSDQGGAVTLWVPIYDPIMVAAGSELRTRGIHDLLKQLVGAVGGLALASLLVEALFQIFGGTGLDNEGTPEPVPTTPTPDGAGAPPRRIETAQNLTETVTTHAPAAGSDSLFTGQVSPGLIFFIGGLFILIFILTWTWYNKNKA